MNKKFGQEI